MKRETRRFLDLLFARACHSFGCAVIRFALAYRTHWRSVRPQIRCLARSRNSHKASQPNIPTNRKGSDFSDPFLLARDEASHSYALRASHTGSLLLGFACACSLCIATQGSLV